MQNSENRERRLHNRVAAGKQPVGVLPQNNQMVLNVLKVL
jgi:hypothetical protein